MNKVLIVIAAACTAGLSQPALAYVGPGAGLSLLGALWGLLLALGAALVFLVLWPWRRYRQKRARARNAADRQGGTKQRPARAHARRDSGTDTGARHPPGHHERQAPAGRG
jgi:membrane protein implicated in regulation of membrane protease activity